MRQCWTVSTCIAINLIFASTFPSPGILEGFLEGFFAAKQVLENRRSRRAP